MARRMLSLLDRALIAVRVEHRLSDAAIGELIGRGRTGVGQGTTPERVEHPRLSARQRKRVRGRPPEAAASAEDRHRPVLAARVRTDLRRPRTSRQVAGRLRLDADDVSVGLIKEATPADGAAVSQKRPTGGLPVDLRPLPPASSP